MIYFCSSLPRTGTTSICKMASICGLKPMHVLDNSKRLIDHISSGYNFFADTPFYNPNFLSVFLECYTEQGIKIIYLDRGVDGWHNSFSKLWSGWKVKPNINNTSKKKIDLLDNLNYEYILQYNDLKKRYNTHKHCIKEIGNIYGVDILWYNFNDGWKTFCDFINKPIPNCEIPLIKNPKP